MRNFFGELKRRNVARMAGLYLVGAWLLVQVAGTVLPMFGAPEWLPRSIVILLAIGFIPALIFSWAFELTPQGLKRDEDVRPEESIAPQTGRRMDRMIIAVLGLALAYFGFDKFVLTPRREAALIATTAKAHATSAPNELPWTAIPEKSIAVLPFENRSEDKANAYFADGIQDEILTRLSKIADLKVISRTSTQHYTSAPENLPEIARQLGVAHILEGSVQKSGEAVRVNVQLIKAANDSHLWADTFDRKLTDIFSVESEVARAIADQLRAQLTGREEQVIAAKPTKNPEAYDLFLKAEYFANQVFLSSAKNPEETGRQAADLYEKASAADPTFALAFARLAYLKARLYWYGTDPSPEAIEAAQSAASRALALQPDLPEAHLTKGYVYYWGRRDYDAALAEFGKAREALPNNANVLTAMAVVHRRQGKMSETIREVEQAALLDPRDNRLPRLIGETLVYMRRYAEADAPFHRALILSPDDLEAQVYRVTALQMRGQLEAASRVLAAIPAASDPGGSVSFARYQLAITMRQPHAALAALAHAPAWLLNSWPNSREPVTLLRAQALALKGETGPAREAFLQAQQALEPLLTQPREQADAESFLALVYAGLEQKNKALEAGHRATELLPPSKDVIVGGFYLAQLAVVEAQVGETQSALDHIEQLLAMPGGHVVSTASLRFEPAWDPLRNDPRFQKLCADKSK
jgi:TolB-like protein/Tfp pilus assembly protein PilF